jgi:hypothetical protein
LAMEGSKGGTMAGWAGRKGAHGAAWSSVPAPVTRLLCWVRGEEEEREERAKKRKEESKGKKKRRKMGFFSNLEISGKKNK